MGSNIGDREAHLAHAVRRLGEEARLVGLSSVYETDPAGYLEQPPFLNMVVRLDTDRSPADLMALLRTIEEERGRRRTFRNAPRTLDLDLLLYGEERITSRPALEVPHPRMTERPFVLVPLLELAPEVREPGGGRPYREWLTGGEGGVRRLFAGERLLEPDA